MTAIIRVLRRPAVATLLLLVLLPAAALYATDGGQMAQLTYHWRMQCRAPWLPDELTPPHCLQESSQ